VSNSKNSDAMHAGFFRDNLRFNIHTLSYLPRWIIVVIDCAVLMIAFFLLTYCLEVQGWIIF
jgi:hypothetical protein